MSLPHWRRERHAAGLGFAMVAGLDEAGRGALAGPVVAAAVVLDRRGCPKGIRDSKTLTAAARETLYAAITAKARAWAVGISEAEEIDSINVLEATKLAMTRAVLALDPRPDYLILDAVALPAIGITFEATPKADRDVMSVAAASIVAKVTRDRLLDSLHQQFAAWGFAEHKGYGTRVHFQAIHVHGLSPIHRRTFAGIASGTLWGPEEWPPPTPASPRTREDASERSGSR
jgi:ribonuclease HII